MAAPKIIKVNKDLNQLEITWEGEKVYSYPLTFLRDESPDATNKGETILWKHYEAPAKGPDQPGKYEIEKIDVVGNYAIQIRWKDGYDHGIYSWDLLERWGEYLHMKQNLSDKS